MKLNLFPVGLALVVTLSVTGCKHTPPKVTSFQNRPRVENPSTPQPDYSAKPIAPVENAPKVAPYTGGPIEEYKDWELRDVVQSIDKLAPYTVHFKYDSAVVEDSEQANLTAVSEALKADPKAKLLIAGYCDERGTEEYNRSLGERRALILREALAKMGITPDRVRTTSFGKDQPADNGHNETAWAKNRRGQFIWCLPKAATS